MSKEGGDEKAGEKEARRPEVKTSVWNCDGETIHDTAVEVRMHRKVCYVKSGDG